MPKSKKPKKLRNKIDKWKKLALALSIVIVLNVFMNVGIETFYDEPEWDEFCTQELRNAEYKDQASCEDIGGEWRNYNAYYDDYYGRYYDAPKLLEPGLADDFYCNETYTCQMEYDESITEYNRNVFIVLTGLGTLIVISSLYLLVPSAVVSGLMYGGVVSILIGVSRYWSDMDDYLQFIVSGVMLLVLILVGIRKVKDD